MLGVHEGSGAIYVLGKGDPPDHIVKFKSREDPEPVYTQKIPRMLQALKGKKRVDAYPVLTLDAAAEQPVVWIGSTTPWEAFSLYRLVEKDGRLAPPEDKGKGPGFRVVTLV
jgi:hypothetical protein